jgi:hypothetical protein
VSLCSLAHPRNISAQFMNPACFFVLSRSPRSSAPCSPCTGYPGSPLPTRRPPRLRPGHAWLAPPRPTLTPPRLFPAARRLPSRATPGLVRRPRLTLPSSVRRPHGPAPPCPGHASLGRGRRSSAPPCPVPVAPQLAAHASRQPRPAQQRAPAAWPGPALPRPCLARPCLALPIPASACSSSESRAPLCIIFLLKLTNLCGMLRILWIDSSLY